MKSNRKLIIEHYDQTNHKIECVAYWEGTEDYLDFKINITDMAEWLSREGYIGEVTVDLLDGDFDHKTVTKGVKITDFMEEGFDESILSEYLNEHYSRHTAS